MTLTANFASKLDSISLTATHLSSTSIVTQIKVYILGNRTEEFERGVYVDQATLISAGAHFSNANIIPRINDRISITTPGLSDVSSQYVILGIVGQSFGGTVVSYRFTCSSTSRSRI